MATKKQETSIAKQESKDIALPADMPQVWGDENIESKDILIGKALIMQGQSDMVADGIARSGEIRHTLTEKMLGNSEKAFQFIPFYEDKTWVISKKPANAGDKVRFEYVETIPYNANNAQLEWEEQVGEDIIRRDLSMNYYCLDANEIDALPILISLRRTSLKAGKQLASFILQLKGQLKTMASRVFELTTEQKEKDGSKFFIAKTKMTDTNTTNKQLVKAYEWYKTVRAGLVRVEETLEETDAAPVPSNKKESADEVTEF